MSAAIQDWWRKWRRSKTNRSPGTLLAAAGRSDSNARPVGALAAWLAEYEWDGNDLTPQQAALWLRRWDNDAAQRRAARLTPAQRGPGVERPALASHYRTGREIFVRTHAILGVRDTDGRWKERTKEVDD
eukprot:1184393-Pyramimonas_sp.AAC.1